MDDNEAIRVLRILQESPIPNQREACRWAIDAVEQRSLRAVSFSGVEVLNAIKLGRAAVRAECAAEIERLKAHLERLGYSEGEEP